MKEIELRDGTFARVDDDDFEKVSEHRWSRLKRYAVTSISNRFVSMHRFVMDAPPDKEVHHIDGDGLNNCKSNLSLISPADHRRMRRKRPLKLRKRKRGREAKPLWDPLADDIVRVWNCPFDWAAIDRDYNKRGL